MSFFNLSATGVVAGIAGLAALLYVMQQLRVRYRTIKVPTAQFWQQAAQEAPVRVFRQKFRHWLAYLLTLAICALLWLGFAGPQTDSAEADKYYVLYLDGSAAMAQGDEFSKAVDKVTEDLSRLPTGSREVIWGGAFHDKLLGAHEEAVLFEQRAANLKPEAVPASLEEQLRLLERRFDGNQSVEVRVYGHAGVSETGLADLNSNIKVVRALKAADLGDNRGITALGFAASASGDPKTLDVLVSAEAADGSEVALEQLTFSLDSAPFASNSVDKLAAGKFVVRDVPAEKGIFEAQLTGTDSLSLDNVARIRLPESPFVKVALSATVPASIAAVVEADKALLVSDLADADVAIRAAGEAFGNTLPSFEITDGNTAAFEIRYTGDVSAESVLQRNVDSLGLTQIDAVGLATEMAREISVDVTPADDVKSIGAWGAMFDNRYNFTQSKAFPVFVAQSVRWLADQSAWYPYVQAGAPLFDQSGQFGLAPSASASEVNLNALPVMGGAGELEVGESKLLISLTNTDVTRGSVGVELKTASGGLVALDNLNDVVLLLAMLILLLLAGEWYFYQRGMMP
ncbi:BatA domain-containing protein [Porticoccaceae bacterium LTM1]|nr:BatA domain-containing protein [Porticoccaceae bacterium LTM1]